MKIKVLIYICLSSSILHSCCIFQANAWDPLPCMKSKEERDEKRKEKIEKEEADIESTKD